MRYRLLGRCGLRVSEICLGTMTFMDTLPWGTTREESRRIFETFAEAGGNFVDTSGNYACSEEYLGEFMGSARQRFVIGTKYTGSEATTDPNSSGNHRKSLIAAVEASLRRLRTEYLDILWLTAWDGMTPADEIMRSLDDLVRMGKLLYVGASNTPAWFVARANMLAELRGWTPFVGLELCYNLLQREAERELLPMARALDLGVTAWTPLAGGYLTGKYREPAAVAAGPRRLDDPIASRFVARTPKNAAIVEELAAVASAVGCSPAQAALNWLRQRRVIPIVGARSAGQLADDLDCLRFPLAAEHLQRLDQVSASPLGYPHDFLAAGMVKQHLFGGMFAAIDNHRLVGSGI